MMCCGSIEALVVRYRYGLVNTLGVYVNRLEYTELLDGLFLIGYMKVRYSLLCTLGHSDSEV